MWGKRYLLQVVEEDAAPTVELKHSKLRLKLRPGSSLEKKRDVLEDWYRTLVKDAIPALIEKWGQRLGVNVDRVVVRRMKTKWGSCTPSARSIRVNTELAKKPPECLEYIVVHEMVHMRVRRHDDRFIARMDQHLPG